MKTPSDELFNLVKSLSTQEKVQFKIYASRKEADNYKIILFDAVNGLERYDESLLKEKLRHKLPVKDFHVLKNYTIEAILRAMAQYHASDSVNARLHRYLQDIYFLIKKRLFDSARKVIAKAEKLAFENNKNDYLFIVFSLKQEIAIEEVNVEEIKRYAANQYADEVKCIGILKNNIDYSRLYMQVESINYSIHGQFEKTSRPYRELTALLSHPLLRHERRALSLDARLKYYCSLGNIFRLLSDWRKSYANYKIAVRLLEQSPAYLNSRIEFYFTTVDRLSVAMVRLKRHRELIALYNGAEHVMRSLPRKLHSGSILQSYLSIRIHYVEYLLSVFDIQSALRHSEEIKGGIKEYNNPEQFLIFQGNLFFIYSFLNDYRKALGPINEILNAEKAGIRQDIVNNARIFNLVVHYELGNEELLPGLSRAAFRSLKKKKSLHKAEKILLAFFGKTIHKHRGDRREKAFADLKRELAAVLSGRNLFDNFDFGSWAESKIKNRPYLEIAKKNAGKEREEVLGISFAPHH